MTATPPYRDPRIWGALANLTPEEFAAAQHGHAEPIEAIKKRAVKRGYMRDYMRDYRKKKHHPPIIKDCKS